MLLLLRYNNNKIYKPKTHIINMTKPVIQFKYKQINPSAKLDYKLLGNHLSGLEQISSGDLDSCSKLLFGDDRLKDAPAGQVAAFREQYASDEKAALVQYGIGHSKALAKQAGTQEGLLVQYLSQTPLFEGDKKLDVVRNSITVQSQETRLSQEKPMEYVAAKLMQDGYTSYEARSLSKISDLVIKSYLNAARQNTHEAIEKFGGLESVVSENIQLAKKKSDAEMKELQTFATGFKKKIEGIANKYKGQQDQSGLKSEINQAEKDRDAEVQRIVEKYQNASGVLPQMVLELERLAVNIHNQPKEKPKQD